MATTATITINSADLTGDTLSITKTATFNKAGSTTALEQTTGLNHKIYTDASADQLLINGTDFGTNVAAKVYILTLDQLLWVNYTRVIGWLYLTSNTTMLMI